MAYSLSWMLPVLRGAGLKVVEEPGWTERACRPGARGEMGRIDGVMCHHTASTSVGNIPTLRVLRDGRPGVPGPLCQLGLGRDGSFYLIAAGRANHAGIGDGRYATVSGNSHYIGIEAENPIPHTAAWPEVQLDAYRRGVAAILKHVGAPAERCIAHKEYTKRKPFDPGIDMAVFRAGVAQVMAGTAAIRPLIPAADAGGRRTIRRGDRGDDVARLQQALRLAADGRFGAGTEAAMRAWQRAHDLVPDGIVGPRSWAALLPA